MLEKWLKFDSAETGRKAESLLVTVDNEVCLTNNYCWIDFPNADYARIGCQSTGYLDNLTAVFICRELSKRFPVINIGCSERGWTPDKITWLQEFKPESTANIQAATVIAREVEAFFRDVTNACF